MSGWELVGGRLATYPAAVTWGGSRLDAFVAGTDHVLWHAWSTAVGVWSWESLGCMLQNAPTAVTWGTNRLDVFWEGLDRALWHRAFD